MIKYIDMPYRGSLREGGDSAYISVVNTGFEHRILFRSSADYEHIIKLLRRQLRTTPELHIVAYCILPHSLHLIFYENTRNSVPQFMQRLSIAYGIYFNQRYNQTGKVFKGPYGDSLLDTPDAVIQELCAVHNKPASYGQEIEHYEWSSYRHYLSGKKTWVDTSFVASYFDTQQYVHDLRAITSMLLPKNE